MGFVIKAGLGLAVALVAGLAVYGYVVDMAPAPAPVTQSVLLNAQ